MSRGTGIPADPSRTESSVARPFPHDAHVLRGNDPPSAEPSPGSPAVDAVAAAHAPYHVRLRGIDPGIAEPFLRVVGSVGGVAHTEESGPGISLDLFIGARQVEALRAQLLTAPGAQLRLAEEIVAALGAWHRRVFRLRCGDREIVCGERPLLMGVVNCTPDSFYEGSRAAGEAAVERGIEMVRQGADLLDVGGESTRPGSQPVEADEEIERVAPVIEALAARVDVPLSVDTTKAAVARAALAAGATMVNDVSGLSWDPGLGEVVAAADVPLVLMHTRGRPSEMYDEADYGDVVAEVIRELREAMARARRAGIAAERLVVDPGLGFAKRARHSLMLLRHLSALRSLGAPILVGPSRKSFIGAVLDLPPWERLEGTAAAVALSVSEGAHIVRVHDVQEMRRVADVAAAIRSEGVGWIS